MKMLIRREWEWAGVALRTLFCSRSIRLGQTDMHVHVCKHVAMFLYLLSIPSTTRTPPLLSPHLYAKPQIQMKASQGGSLALTCDPRS